MATDRPNILFFAEKSVKMAQEQGWTVISMANDWEQVFSFQNSE
jgi:hypothetical protein